MARLLSTKQVASEVGLTDHQIRGLVQRKQLKHVRIGNRVYIPVGAFDDFIQENTVIQCLDEDKGHASNGSKNAANTISSGQTMDAATSAARAQRIAQRLKSR